MTPYYDDGRGIVIYHGDCRDVLPYLSGDAIVTDPPYGIKFDRATWGDDPENYPQLIRWLVKEASRCVPNGWCFVFQAMPNVSRFSAWFPDGWRIYAACKNFAQIRPTVWHSWDPVIFWANGQAFHGKELNRDYYVGNVAGVFADGNGHPCPKPLDTMRHIVSIASAPGATVLDPFMGSGTTLVAAKQLGRRAIGIEIEARYCEIAAQRVEEAALPLFDKAPEATQALFEFQTGVNDAGTRA